jgi:hypothetical protein
LVWSLFVSIESERDSISYFDAFSSREPVSTPVQVRGRLSLETLYLLRPEPGPVGVNVDPLGEALGPSVLPDGLWVLFGLVTGAVVVEPAVLPVVVPLVDEPVMVPLAADPPAAELPPVEPLPLCASARLLERRLLESANAAASTIVVSFIVISLGLLTQG